MAFVTRFNLMLGAVSSWSYGLVFLLTIYEVFVRYFLHSPTIWSLELSLIIVGVGYTMGGVKSTVARSHLRIDVFYNRCPERVQRVLDVFISLITIGFLAAVVWAGGLQALSSIELGEHSGSAWNSTLPMIQKILIPIAATLMLIQESVNMFQQPDSLRDSSAKEQS